MLTSYRLAMESGSDPAGPQFYRYAIPENIGKHVQEISNCAKRNLFDEH
jgi:hypothetical protein